MLRNDGGMVVVSPSTGEVLQTNPPLPFIPSDGGLTRIEGDVMLYQAENNTQVVAYDLSRQQLLWSTPLRREIAELLACEVHYLRLRPVEPDRFLAIVDGHVLGCSLADGSILWHRAAPFVQPGGPPMAVVQGRLYWMTFADQHDAAGERLADPPAPFRLSCIDATTGQALYDVETPERTTIDIPSWPAVHSGYIAFGETFTSQGLVTLHRLEDGKPLWSYRYKTAVGKPAMTDRGLLVCSDDGNLLIFDAMR
jgi:outer membrane protein assembly factor BamB